MKKSRTPRPSGTGATVQTDPKPSPSTVSSVATSRAAETGFPVVGIGASAGGLAAFEAFFAGMPPDAIPPMAFVLVQHLAPDHKSILAELVRRYTPMPVFEVEDGMQVNPGCVYIIPPKHDMAYLNGTLHLLEPSAPRGQRLPIDFFFRSLAQDQHERAIGIVLSGTGSDGSQGVRAIKGEAGMVMVQTPASTEFDGMPRSAIATGTVDFELLPAEMPARLIAYVSQAVGRLPRLPVHLPPKTESALRRIFILLRAQTGHDFSQYKPSTINRRIERRMAVHQIEEIEDYAKYLQSTPIEVDALFRDLLIGVTNFFRDREAFQALEEHVIPQLFSGKASGGAVRVWSAGCSTGEEAYSLAILLQERMEALKQSYVIQVFATDIDNRAIATARAGFYPASIAADISPERLARFFTAEPEGAGYRIHKAIRDLLVFSEQDVIKDPPFSKLDLISCRNLLIYLGAELQNKLIPLFHYALKPGGTLFLGTSEGIGDFDELFVPIDRKAKLYRRKEGASSIPRGPMRAFVPTGSPLASAPPQPRGKPAAPPETSLRELTEQALLQQLAPVCALVSKSGDILYLRGRTGMFLEPAQGESGVNNILTMAREGLRSAMTTALREAVSRNESTRAQNLRVKTNGHFTLVDLSVHPTSPENTGLPDAALYLVILSEAQHAPDDSASPVVIPGNQAGNEAEVDARISALRQELRAKEEFLQSTREELESSNEELKSSNEEMQSVNEELQSTNEELETSKEELQSVNEELATVNNELQTKVSDLSRLNNDMNNLLAGTGIATVFVDQKMRILRFTPAAAQIINLIPGDVGRPVGDLVAKLVGYSKLVADVQTALDTLALQERQVQTTGGQWFTMRIRPYRTLDDKIEGVVITFVDVTERRQIEDELHKANELSRLAVVVRDASDAITVHELSGRTTAWNPGAVRIYGFTEAEALKLNVRDRIPAELREQDLAMIQKLSRGEVLVPYRTRRLTKAGATVQVSLTSSALVDAAGQVYAIATTERLVEGAAR